MGYLFGFAKAGIAGLCLAAVILPYVVAAPPSGWMHAHRFRTLQRKEETMSQPELKLNKIALLMLGVKDFKKSVAFYRDTLGLPPQGEVPGEFAFFNAGGVMLALSVPHASAKFSPSVVGGTEVVFSVESVTAAYEALRARGVAFVREPQHAVGENWSAIFTDPDGHRLSIFGPKN
jgi:catechol 2,3-dioxygenase-like lactoylglutathione lyase family enzyme